MQYRFLGNSGLRVSEVCLGTMNFAVTTGQEEATRIVSQALDAGVNFVDTADSYAGSECEVLVGNALKGRRDKVVLATKFTNPMGPRPNDSGWSRRHIMDAVEGCLKRLQTDTIDLLYIHHIEHRAPLEEALRAMDDLVHQGKVNYVGCSNFEAWRLVDGLWISDHNGLSRFIAYQPQYSLAVRDIEAELVPACLAKNVGIVCWGPLASGFLTGKYKPGQRSVEGTRSAEGWLFHNRFFSPKADEALAELLVVADEAGKTPAQTALRWALQMPGITSVIAGARSAEQFKDSCGASGWSLSNEQMERLCAASEPQLSYPAAMELMADVNRDKAIDMPSL